MREDWEDWEKKDVGKRSGAPERPLTTGPPLFGGELLGSYYQVGRERFSIVKTLTAPIGLT